MPTPLLKIEDLSVSFDTSAGRVQAVSGVGLELARGETLGVVGESGCGKSVTALSVLGLVPSPPGFVDSGRIDFDGQDLLALDPEALRRIRGNRIGMIFQEPMTALNPVLTVGRQLTEGLMAHRQLTKRAAQKRAVDWLVRVRVPGARKRLRDYPHQLSGGMRQRIVIAMAMICRPSLVIADEPTTALDVSIQAQILSLMLSLKQEMGMALLLISHDLGIIAQAAARVVVMYAGQVVERADTLTLFEEPFHPYTQGLLESIPRTNRQPGQAPGRLKEIRGSVPTLLDIVPGCRFARRCRHAFSLCRRECPPLASVAPNHQARCWLERHPELRRPDV